MRLSDFDYELPADAIAQRPVEPRDAARLLVVHRCDGRMEHRTFRELTDYLRSGDTLVVNDTRVIPARVYATKETGGRVELLLLARRAPGEWEAMVRPGRRVPPGTRLCVAPGGLEAEVLERTAAGGRVVRFSGAPDPDAALLGAGEIPLPPYVLRPPDESDRVRYQTVYAARDGSAAAPTAGMHFTEELLARVRSLGVAIAAVTLHIGLATFQPVRVENVAEHRMHLEQYVVTPEAAEVINATPGRVVAVGTTTTRVLESVADEAERVRPGAGTTGLFICPGYRFRVVDALVTNFHMPRSTLLMMVSAFAGRELVLASYQEALRCGYRFLSFGDAMLIL